jgi:rare lipoprotein A
MRRDPAGYCATWRCADALPAVAVLLAVTPGMSGCVVLRAPAPAADRAVAAEPARSRFPGAGRSEVGLASWYGEPHHGQPTASGETFDMARLTAAHRTLPLGTRLQVMNLENGRIVRVRVNDRGPYVAGRVLDLSYGAARALEMVERGVVPVKFAIVEED